MNHNFKIVIEYDGSQYSGWQRQNDTITVQKDLEDTLSKILNQSVTVIGSGRTDAGVHALGQAANFHADTGLSCGKIKEAVNSCVKGAVVIKECRKVHQTFHARYDATGKEYHYHILNREEPCAIGRDYVWHVKNALDVEMMQRCCESIVGKHDFKSFEGSGSPRSDTKRTIFSAEVKRKENDMVVFKICGNGFLRFMVRNLAGTLVLAGLSKIDSKKFTHILHARERKQAGATAPPRGLFLMNVTYPSHGQSSSLHTRCST